MSSKDEKLILSSILSSQATLAKTSEEKDKQNKEAMEKIAPLIVSKQEMIKSWNQIEEMSHCFSNATGFDFSGNIPEYLDEIRFWLNVCPTGRILEDLYMKLKREVERSHDRSTKRLNNVMLNADRANQYILMKGTKVINENERFKELERAAGMDLEEIQ